MKSEGEWERKSSVKQKKFANKHTTSTSGSILWIFAINKPRSALSDAVISILICYRKKTVNGCRHTQFREPLQTVTRRVKVSLKISHLSIFLFFIGWRNQRKCINAYHSNECNVCYKHGTLFQYLASWTLGCLSGLEAWTGCGPLWWVVYLSGNNHVF